MAHLLQRHPKAFALLIIALPVLNFLAIMNDLAVAVMCTLFFQLILGVLMFSEKPVHRFAARQFRDGIREAQRALDARSIEALPPPNSGNAIHENLGFWRGRSSAFHQALDILGETTDVHDVFMCADGDDTNDKA
jgi:hypothetical protein